MTPLSRLPCGFFLLCLCSHSALGALYCVLSTATGANTGVDWTNAFTALPSTLERGSTYYIGAGTYAGYTFDDPVEGTAVITILRATQDQHGPQEGWMDSYGATAPSFGPLDIRTNYHVVDGITRNGIDVLGNFEGTTVKVAAGHVSLRNINIDSRFTKDGEGKHNGGSCAVLQVTGDDNQVEDCDIHNAADDGGVLRGDSMLFKGNAVFNLHGCGTDGGCGNCFNGHSDGLELYHVTNSQFIGNFLHNISSTSAIFLANFAPSSAEWCENLLFSNNIIYTPEVGLVTYLQYVRTVKLFHNVFWGTRKGSYGGFALGQGVTDMDMYNNIFLSINLNHLSTTYNAAEHRSDYNLFGANINQFPLGPNDVVNSNTGFANMHGPNGPSQSDVTPQDFMLVEGSAARGIGFIGNATVVLPTLDFFNHLRDAQPDAGPIEFGATGPSSSTPTTTSQSGPQPTGSQPTQSGDTTGTANTNSEDAESGSSHILPSIAFLACSLALAQ